MYKETKKRELGVTYIATISGGKDSVAMTDLLLKNGYPVDYIVFHDTLIELDEMYEYIEKLKKYFKERYNKEIIVTKPKFDFETLIFRKRVRGNRKGEVAGLFDASSPFCEWRREAKIKPFERFLKEKNIKNYKIYIGFTTDEKHRVNRDNKEQIFPLIDYFNMSENDCKRYLVEQEMENPIYRYFNRTGCAICPFQSKRDFYTLYKHYPKWWNYMKDIEKRVRELGDVKKENLYWFVDYKTCEDLEKEFKKMDKQKSLFELDDEPAKDCFCRI